MITDFDCYKQATRESSRSKSFEGPKKSLIDVFDASDALGAMVACWS